MPASCDCLLGKGHIVPMFAAAALFISMGAAPAQASCGLDRCPMPADGAESPALFSATSTLRHTTAAGGWYGEAFVGAVVQPTDWSRLEASMPFVVYAGDDDIQGLGNSVVLAELLWVGDDALSVGGGLQAELPTATDDALGDDHLVLLPYMSVHAMKDRTGATTWLGWGRALGTSSDTTAAHHGHDHSHAHQASSTLEVNPHSASEMLGRVELGHRLPFSSSVLQLRPFALVSGWLPLGDEDAGLTAGGGLGLGLGLTTARISASAPLTSPERSKLRLSAGVHIPFGR